jgi:hypothetical protein
MRAAYFCARVFFVVRVREKTETPDGIPKRLTAGAHDSKRLTDRPKRRPLALALLTFARIA